MGGVTDEKPIGPSWLPATAPVWRLAEQHGLESVAFCCISTGEFHFPNGAGRPHRHADRSENFSKSTAKVKR
ncbi:MAG: macro domain-containing protein [Lachnospiraceae bacterium]